MKEQVVSLPVAAFAVLVFGLFFGGFAWGYVIHKIKTKHAERKAAMKNTKEP